MKKLILLALPLLFLTGCSLTNKQPTEAPETTTVTTETGQAVSTTFDSSKIVLEWPEICPEWSECYIEWDWFYKDILPFKNGFIWITIWWNDWYTISLIYTENWKTIKTSNPFFWDDRKGSPDWESSPTIYQYCLPYGTSQISDQRTDSSKHSLDQCITVKTIGWCDDIATKDASECTIKVFEYVFNLIQWNEVNSYFTQKLENFKNSL
jgi:hypothetical protein